jgi:CDGSH-type Zn-finger protein
MSQEQDNTQIIAQVLPNGPIVIHGDFIIRDAEGVETQRTVKTSLCRCGASAKKPYCDGSHRKAGFEG